MDTPDTSLPALPANGLLAFIERAARDPEFDIAKFGALLDRHEAMAERQRRAAFNHDMADVQAEIGRILRTGKNPSFNNPYARLEDLDRAARPIYSAHGFSVRYGSAQAPREGWLRVTLTIAHRDGYSEEHYLDGPIDAQASERRARTAIQAVGSTVTYLRRYLLQMVLNLVAGNDPEDDDGEATRRGRPEMFGPPPPEEDPRDRVNRELPLTPRRGKPTIGMWLDDMKIDLMTAATQEDVDRVINSDEVQRALQTLKGEPLDQLNTMVRKALERTAEIGNGKIET